MKLNSTDTSTEKTGFTAEGVFDNEVITYATSCDKRENQVDPMVAAWAQAINEPASNDQHNYSLRSYA